MVFQNCGNDPKSFQQSDDFCVQNPTDSSCLNKQVVKSCLFNGSEVKDSSQITAFLNSTVPNGSSCVLEVRSCSNGSLSGSYAYATCAVGAPASCLFNGRTIAHGAKVKAYLSSVSAKGAACVVEDRTCANGSLSGSYQYSSCALTGFKSCLFNGSTVAHGVSITAFEKSSVPSGQLCSPITRTCQDGVLSGSGSFASCNVAAPSSCVFNSQTVAHSQVVTAYHSSTVPFGASCAAKLEQRKCTNGILSGTAAFASCQVNSPAACAINGATVPHNGTIQLYHAQQATSTVACSRETRTCTNGALSGSARFASCTTPCPTMIRVLPGLKAIAATDGVKFGSERVNYGSSYPWMTSNKPFSDFASNVRTVSYHLTSNDCGATWTRGQELFPYKLDGRPQDIGNGPSTAVFNSEGDALNRGFFSHINWQYWWRSRIYPYFDFGNGLEYQALNANKQEILPIIGSNNLTVNDHFYSPSPVVNSNGSVQLYFGGWRDTYYEQGQIPTCTVTNWTATSGPVQEECWCATAKASGATFDSCAGDRIFVATNNPSVTGDNNRLSYKVYSKNGAFSTSGWGPSKNFKPVISPAQINAMCTTAKCPHKISHANDPSVIRTKSGLYIMYFTGGIGNIDSNGKMINYTYLATSTDGLNFSNFAVLGKNPSGRAYFPFGLPYNQANGTAKVYYDSYRDRIYMAFLATPDTPLVPRVDGHRDAWVMFVHEISVNEPDKVIRTQRVGHKDAIHALPLGTRVPAQNP